MLQTSWGFATLPNGLRLDYIGTSFSPDQPVYVLQFRSLDTSRLVEIPFGQNTSNSRFNTIISIDSYPFTGHGFIAGQLIPEYHVFSGCNLQNAGLSVPIDGAGLRLSNGAELFRVDPNGTWTPIGRYIGSDEGFIRINN